MELENSVANSGVSAGLPPRDVRCLALEGVKSKENLSSEKPHTWNAFLQPLPPFAALLSHTICNFYAFSESAQIKTTDYHLLNDSGA